MVAGTFWGGEAAKERLAEIKKIRKEVFNPQGQGQDELVVVNPDYERKLEEAKLGVRSESTLTPTEKRLLGSVLKEQQSDSKESVMDF